MESSQTPETLSNSSRVSRILRNVSSLADQLVTVISNTDPLQREIGTTELGFFETEDNIFLKKISVGDPEPEYEERPGELLLLEGRVIYYSPKFGGSTNEDLRLEDVREESDYVIRCDISRRDEEMEVEGSVSEDVDGRQIITQFRFELNKAGEITMNELTRLYPDSDDDVDLLAVDEEAELPILEKFVRSFSELESL